MAKRKHQSSGLHVRAQSVQRVKVSDLVDHPYNFRTHDGAQYESLESTLKQVGWYGRPIVRKLSGGKFQLIDGHLRRKMLRDHRVASVEVLVVDLSEEDGLKALATHDPLAGLTHIDSKGLKALLDRVRIDAEALRESLLDDLPMVGEGLDDDDDGGYGAPSESEGGHEVSGVVEYRCPECGHEWEEIATDTVDGPYY